MAAIKRSQANQRRNPDTFHFYQQPTQAAAVKVDLSHLLLAILDDPLVSRVFADAGFRSTDIKLAILRPAPPMPLLGRLPTRARPPPLFLCSFAAADDADVPSPACGGLAGTGAGGENCRRIAEILSRGRNPMLVGVGAASAASEFAAASHYRIVPIRSNPFNPTELSVAATSSGGLIISIGDLKDLVQEEEEESAKRMVTEVTRLLETTAPTPREGRVWVMGWSATYETYLAFLSKFPLLDKDWDLQLLPVTALQPPQATGAATTTLSACLSKPPPPPPPAAPTPSTSLMESIVPFGGFFGDAYEANSLTANSCPQALRCQQCNNRYEQEVATIIRGSGITVENNHEGCLSSLLQNGSMMGPNSGFDAVQVRNDQMVLNSKILNLQKKWNDYCLRLHQGCQRINRHPDQLFPHYVGVSADRERAANPSRGPDAVAPQREVIKPSAVSTLYTNTTAKSISSPSISNQSNDDLVLKLQVRQSKSDEQLQDRGVQSQHSNRGDHVLPSSAAPVATDLVLGTPHEYALKGSSSSPCKHGEDAERSVQLMPSKVDDLNLKPAQHFVQPYTCSRSLTTLGPTTPGALHSAASGGNSAFGQWQRPSPLPAQSSDMSNYKLLVENLFKAVGRQEEALGAICKSIVQCRSMERHRGAYKKKDIWFSFHGPDSIAKRRVAAALAELMHGSSDNLIYLDLGHQDWGDSSFRGKTGTDCIVDELRKKRRSVIFLDNIDKADCLVQDSLSRAIEIGRFDDWHGRAVDLNDSIVILSTRMTRECKTAALGMEECHAFSEEKLMAARGHQLKILVEPGAGNISGEKAVVSSGHSVTGIQASLYSGSASKRKLNISDGQENIQESPSTSKRLHRTSSVPFDLNLPVDDEPHDADADSSSHDDSSGNPDGSVENLLHSVDESINFKPFDFGKLCEDILQEFSSIMSNIMGPDCRLEINVGAMLQILAATWASDQENRTVRTWLDQVFARSLEELKLKCKNVIKSTMRIVVCEGAPLKDDGFGALLPSRIILEW